MKQRGVEERKKADRKRRKSRWEEGQERKTMMQRRIFTYFSLLCPSDTLKDVFNRKRRSPGGVGHRRSNYEGRIIMEQLPTVC